MAPPVPEGRRDGRRRALAVGAVLWASFLSACAGTMFFFAFVAPEDLVGNYPESDRIDRLGVYTLGFFGLWCLGALASALALYVHRHISADERPGSSQGTPS
ncbi:MAG: hypothetical protein JSR15_02240 [Proteobacteria bacterium]|nr:hypothetical protein [Pseudomonadota bacterium]